MLRVFAYDHYTAFSFDDLAFFADLLNGRFNFHFCVTCPFIIMIYAYLDLQVIRPLERS